MTVYGGDFLTAHLITGNPGFIDDPELLSGGDDYFRIAVTQADNSILIILDVMTASVGLTVYDKDEVQLYTYYNGNDISIRLVDLPVGDVFFKVHSFGGASPGVYSLFVALWENGVPPPPPTVSNMLDANSVSLIDKPFGWHDTVEGQNHILWNRSSTQASWLGTEHQIGDYTVHDRGANTPGHGVIKVYGDATPHVSNNYSGQQYHLSGTVKKEGIVYANRTLRLYDRKTGRIMGETISDAGGNWKFNAGLFPDLKYYVIAFDDMGSPELQAVIHDALLPIAD